jgi:hypothetical protein
MPDGFDPETPTAPAPSRGEVLSHHMDLGYDRAQHTLHVTREFVSNVVDVPVEAYPTLKSWYDRVARSDQHELIFHGANVPMPEAAPAPAKADAESKKTGETEGESAEEPNMVEGDAKTE